MDTLSVWVHLTGQPPLSYAIALLKRSLLRADIVREDLELVLPASLDPEYR